MDWRDLKRAKLGAAAAEESEKEAAAEAQALAGAAFATYEVDGQSWQAELRGGQVAIRDPTDAERRPPPEVLRGLAEGLAQALEQACGVPAARIQEARLRELVEAVRAARHARGTYATHGLTVAVDALLAAVPASPA